MANDEVFFDDKSGISIEEQKEILSVINGIAEKNKKRLSQGTVQEIESQVHGNKTQIKAGKSGAFFPLAVNISAAAVLCAGALFLFSSNGNIDSQLRAGNVVYNLTEKALIEEIRKDTAEKIAAKDQEISIITSRLEEVDAQLSLLHSSNYELNSDQLETQDRLLDLQNSYREELAALHDERSLILENSRSREVAVRSQLEERVREFSAAQQRISSELDSAVRELEMLSNEQEKIAAIDAHLAGAFVSIGVLVQNGQYDQALSTAVQLRDFLNNNSYASARSFQMRRDFYYQSVNLAEAMISLNSAGGGTQNISGNHEQNGLAQTNAQMEQTIADMQKTIDALSSGSSGQAARLGELEETISALRASISVLENSSAEKDRTISSLETERDGLTRTNQAQEQEINRLNNQLDAILQTFQNN